MGSTRPRIGVASLLLAVIAALIAGCGSSDGGTDPTSSGADGGAEKVMIADYLYDPDTITVPVGATVTFANADAAPHTATSKRSGAFESGTIETGRTGKVTLEESGTFAYYCLFHPFMKGTIVVT
jgi:plastocyanin